MDRIRNRQTCFVEDVKKDGEKKPKLWTVIVHMVEIHRTAHSDGKTDGRRKLYKRLLMVDERGTKVSGVLYENDIQYFASKLKAGKRYMVSNARLSKAYGHFLVSNYEYTWTITHETPVEPIQEVVPPPFPFTYETCAYKDFQLFADKEEGINVKGVAVHVFPWTQITPECRKREIVLIDESKTPVILAVTGSFADFEGQEIADRIQQAPLIMAVNVRVTTFHGISLASRMFSCILIDPPLPDAAVTKNWYRQNKSVVTTLLSNKAYDDIQMHLPPPKPEQTIGVPTSASVIVNAHTAWVRGKLRCTIIPNYDYYISCCRNCHKKTKAGHDCYMRCSSCEEEGQIELRCSVPVELTGDGHSLQVLLTSPDVEMLTGITPCQLKDSDELGLGVEEQLAEKLNFLEVICFLQKYNHTQHGTRRGPGLRFPAGKVYKVSDLPITSAGLASQLVPDAGDHTVKIAHASNPQKEAESTALVTKPLHEKEYNGVSRNEDTPPMLNTNQAVTKAQHASLPNPEIREKVQKEVEITADTLSESTRAKTDSPIIKLTQTPEKTESKRKSGILDDKSVTDGAGVKKNKASSVNSQTVKEFNFNGAEESSAGIAKALNIVVAPDPSVLRKVKVEGNQK